MLACGEREAMVTAPPPTCDSAVSPCFHGCLAFLHQHFHSRSPPLHPLNPCGQTADCLSTVNSSPSLWDCSATPKLWLLATVLPGNQRSCPGMYGRSKDCLILIPFSLPQMSCFTLSLKCFSSESDSCPDVGIGPLLQFPHP